MIDHLSKEEQTLLKELLIKYFSKARFGEKNFFQRDSIAALLKKSLLNVGHWRYQSRNANPKVSEQMINNKEEKQKRIKEKEELEAAAKVKEEVAEIKIEKEIDDCPF